MSQGIFKNGEAIEVTYQAAAATPNLIDVTMIIYDEGHALDGVGFPDVTLTEIETDTGRYYGSFTPDAEGEWTVIIDSATKPGKVVKKYSVIAHNVDSIGDAVATADGKIDAVDTVVDAIKVVTDAESGTKAAVTTVDGKVDAVDTVVDAIKVVTDAESGTKAAVTTVDGKADGIKAKTDTLPASPAAAGEAETAEGNIRGGSDTLATLSDQLDGVASPDSPPMTG